LLYQYKDEYESLFLTICVCVLWNIKLDYKTNNAR
jgi:hypothetical protein